MEGFIRGTSRGRLTHVFNEGSDLVIGKNLEVIESMHECSRERRTLSGHNLNLSLLESEENLTRIHCVHYLVEVIGAELLLKTEWF